MNAKTIFADLQSVIESRLSEDAQSSYVAGLHLKGVDAILKKVAEEAGEVIIAGKNADPIALQKEIADLWFHCMVLLAHRGMSITDIQNELSERFGISGIDEKNSRAKTE